MRPRNRTLLLVLVLLAFLPAGASQAQEQEEPAVDEHGPGARDPPPHEFIPATFPDELGGLVSDGGVPSAFERDTSNYMIGSVYVQVVFIESDGRHEAETEDWSSARKTQVMDKVAQGLAFWDSNIPAGNPLSFTIGDPRTARTGWEPIKHAGSGGTFDFKWLREGLTDMGITVGTNTCGPSFDCAVYDAIRGWDHRMRNTHGTDWAFTVFVVDSLNDGDGRFSDSTTAYAYLGGPYVIMTYDNGGWGITNMHRVLAHETGHIFGATDEYKNPGQSWGYYWKLETDDSGRVMDNDNVVDPPSAGTKRQIGWIDSDGDDLLDPRDTRPDTISISGPAITRDTTPRFTGTAKDVPSTAHEDYRARGHSSISINPVNSVRYTVDGGSAVTVGAEPDSAFSADFSFATAALSDGLHTIRVQAVNKVGAIGSTGLSTTVRVDTRAPALSILDPEPGQVYVGRTKQANLADPEAPATYVGSFYANATAADTNSGIDRVQFLVDGEEIAMFEERPYEASLLAPDVGEHTLVVKAWDRAGNVATATRGFVVVADV